MCVGRLARIVVLATYFGAGGAIEPVWARVDLATVAQADATAELDALLNEGVGLLQEGSAESLRLAISQFARALELAQAARDQAKQAAALMFLGYVHSNLDENAKALEFYNKALSLRRVAGNRWGEAVILNNIGSVYDALDEKEKALEFYNLALPLRRAVGDRFGEGATLNNIGHVYSALGEKEKALEFFNLALPLMHAVGDRSGKAVTLNNIGRIHDALGEKEKALEFFNLALSLMHAVGDRSGEAVTLNNIGLVYFSLGEKDKALKFYNLALPLRRAVGDRSGEAATLGNIGAVYDALGEKAKALEFFNLALPLRRAVGDRSGEASTLGNIGAVYDALGEKAKALEFYNQSLLFRREVGDLSGEAATLSNIGTVYLSLGEQAKALEFFNLALPLWRAVGDRSGEANTLGNIGAVYDVLGEKAKALEFYNQALLLSRAVGDRSGEAATLGNIGVFYDALGEKAKALEFYNQSLLLRREVGDRFGEAATHSSIAFTLVEDQPTAAVNFYKQSINLYETLRQDIRTLPRETQEIFTSSVAGTYRDLANVLLTQNRTREAQAVLELLKVQEFSLYETNAEADATPPVQFPLHPLEAQAWQAAETAIASQTLTLDTLTAFGQPLEQNKAQIAKDLNNSPLDIGNPQAVLNANPNALFIQNLVVGDKLWVLWTDASGKTTSVTIPNVSQADLNATVQTFREQIGSPYSNLNDLKATSEKLYNWLIPQQLQDELAAAEAAGQPTQQLIFSLDHVTRYVPVAALYDSKQPDGQQYLAQRYTLSNLVTTETDMEERLSPNGRPPNILALGTSQAHPGFSALPNVDAELKAIVKDGSDAGNSRGIYPGKIRLNEAFTAAALQDNLDSYEVLHIATHGSFNPKSISASYLLLGDGGQLPITDIASLTNLDETHLVVLSACETGLSGSSQDGTEISGISGYFLRRGAKSVLASLWSVNDASTALLMQQFYQHLEGGELTKAEALQKVQREFIAGELTVKEAKDLSRAGVKVVVPEQHRSDSFAHPYYWAPFVLVGNSL